MFEDLRVRWIWFKVDTKWWIRDNIDMIALVMSILALGVSIAKDR